MHHHIGPRAVLRHAAPPPLAVVALTELWDRIDPQPVSVTTNTVFPHRDVSETLTVHWRCAVAQREPGRMAFVDASHIHFRQYANTVYGRVQHLETCDDDQSLFPGFTYIELDTALAFVSLARCSTCRACSANLHNLMYQVDESVVDVDTQSTTAASLSYGPVLMHAVASLCVALGCEPNVTFVYLSDQSTMRDGFASIYFSNIMSLAAGEFRTYYTRYGFAPPSDVRDAANEAIRELFAEPWHAHLAGMLRDSQSVRDMIDVLIAEPIVPDDTVGSVLARLPRTTRGDMWLVLSWTEFNRMFIEPVLLSWRTKRGYNVDGYIRKCRKILHASVAVILAKLGPRYHTDVGRIVAEANMHRRPAIDTPADKPPAKSQRTTARASAM